MIPCIVKKQTKTKHYCERELTTKQEVGHVVKDFFSFFIISSSSMLDDNNYLLSNWRSGIIDWTTYFRKKMYKVQFGYSYSSSNLL